MLDHFSHISIIIAALICYFIGFIWYSPALFGKLWGEAFKQKEKIGSEEMKPAPEMFIGSLVMALVLAYGSAILFEHVEEKSSVTALWFTCAVWITYVATTHFSGVIWARKPVIMYLIDIFCVFAQILGITLFLSWWS